jgi:beta-lactamase regulating signal transducer with metallopeptidase domain
MNAAASDEAGRSDSSPNLTIGQSFSSVIWLWVGGSAVLLLIFVAGLVALTRLTRRSPPFEDGRIVELTRELALAHGIHERVPVLRGRAGAMPMSWGLSRGVIFLPVGAEGWDDSLLHAVLRHELAHVRRRDCLTQAIAEVSLALNWLNPLAWLAVRRLRVEREHACDDAVVLAGVRPSDYARALIDLAATARPSPGRFRVAAPMIRPVQLHDRLRAVLEDDRPRRSSRAGAASAALLTVVLVGAAAAITPIPDTTSMQASAPREVILPADASLETDFPRLSAPARAVTAEVVVEESARPAIPDRRLDRGTETLRVEVAERRPTIFADVVPLQVEPLQKIIDPDHIEPIEAFQKRAAVRSHEPGEELRAPVTIHVKNQNFHDATLWLVSRLGRVQLGPVTGKAAVSFTTPLTSPVDVWSVEIDLVGGEWCETEPLSVEPGDVLDLLVLVDVSSTPGCYPAGFKPEA